jgi:nitrate/TMAO reductase-like tetraheme cytochrome c subunit
MSRFMRSRVLASILLALSVAACGVPVEQEDGGTGGGGTGGATGGGSGSSGVTWCDVKALSDRQCVTCHGTVPINNAPVMVTRAQWLAASPLGGTMLDRAISRMKVLMLAAAMPPNVGGAPADIATLEAWRAAGTPDCEVDAGTQSPVDAGIPMCSSGRTWSSGNTGRTAMNPGEACVSCHTSRRNGPIDGFMGTVYPTARETPLCMVTSVPAGLTVEILDLAGTVRQTIPVSATNNGNFRGGVVGQPSPYRARVKLNGVVKSEMLTAQTNGDCNVCHTTLGAQGAPGRIHW